MTALRVVERACVCLDVYTGMHVCIRRVGINERQAEIKRTNRASCGYRMGVGPRVEGLKIQVATPFSRGGGGRNLQQMYSSHKISTSCRPFASRTLVSPVVPLELDVALQVQLPLLTVLEPLGVFNSAKDLVALDKAAGMRRGGQRPRAMQFHLVCTAKSSLS